MRSHAPVSKSRAQFTAGNKRAQIPGRYSDVDLSRGREEARTSLTFKLCASTQLHFDFSADCICSLQGAIHAGPRSPDSPLLRQNTTALSRSRIRRSSHHCLTLSLSLAGPHGRHVHVLTRPSAHAHSFAESFAAHPLSTVITLVGRLS